MKKLFTLFTIAALTIGSFAQSPQKMSYQAVVRNTSGVLQANQAVGMKISILQGSETGTAVYVETQTKTTNANGLVTLEIGSGTIVSGTFSGIDWSNGTYLIKTETDPTGGTNYTVTGTSQILSVPYALYAKTAKTADYNDLTNKPTTLSGYGITDAVSVAGTQTISGETTFKGTTPDLEAPLFEVKNKDGQTIFAVYNEGVRIWVADGAKGTKGGFAVGGFDMIHNYLDVSADSVRIYIDSDPSTKKAKGGFAVGGYDMTKGITGDYFNVSGRSEAETINGESRVMWYPFKEAFRSGKVLIESQDSVGTNSWASGFNSKAVGNWSQALGYKAIARADYSTAIGKNAIAAKVNSFAFGEDAKAKNEESYAIGRGAVASGYRSFAFGSAGIDSAGKVTDVARATGDYSVAIGQGSQAVGFGSLSMGIADTASGKYSIALGYGCGANEVGSVSLGYSSKANGNNSTVIGYFSEAKAWASTAIGHGAVASGPFSTAIGVSTRAIGGYSTALGEMTTSGYGATAMGGFTTASGDYSTAMGKSSVATRLGSTAMGESTHATGSYSTSMGGMTQASGTGSTAMGYYTFGSGNYSTAMGDNAVARGEASSAMGNRTISRPYASVAIGRYNDTICSVNGFQNWVDSDPVFIVGNGSDHAYRKNAFTIYKNGSAYIQGSLGIGVSIPSERFEIGGTNSKVYLNSTTSNAVIFNSNGTAIPSFTSRSIGTKLVLYPSLDNLNTDYALGISPNNMWFSIPQFNTAYSYNFYAGTSEVFTIHGTGFADVAGMLRIKGSTPPSNGAGVEIYYAGGSGYISCRDRTAAIYKPLYMYTATVRPIADNSYSLGLSTYRWSVVYAVNGTIQTSDLRLKNNIQPINDGLKSVINLNPVYFNWVDKSDNKRHIGLIAQEVLPVIPDIVDIGEDKDKTLGINYAGLVPVLISAIKEQQQQIESYKSQLQTLQEEVEQIKAMLAKGGE